MPSLRPTDAQPAQPQHHNDQTRPRSERRVFCLSKDLSMARANTPRITIRFTPEEYARLQAMAGDKALSAYVREVVLGANAKRKSPTRKHSLERQQAAQILALLGQDERLAAFKTAASSVEAGIIEAEHYTLQDIQTCRDLLLDIRDRLIAAQGMKP